MKVLEELKEYKLKNDIPVVAGGVFCTFAPDICISYPLVDMVCVGEGEQAIVDLCEKIEKGEDFKNVTNLWVKDKEGTITKNTIIKPVDVNKSPNLDLSLFEKTDYIGPWQEKFIRWYQSRHIEVVHLHVLFAIHQIKIDYIKMKQDHLFQKKRIDLVYEELKYFKEEIGVEYNYFWADTFLAYNANEFDEFCEMYKEINLPFWMQTRPETVTEEKIKKLQKVGLHRMAFGLEHGNEEFRKKY